MSKEDPESSLELLLDTMCNTFGGVMFIGISLVVLMSMLTPVQKQTPADNPEKMRQEFDRLQAELKQISTEVRSKLVRLEDMEKDPRRKYAHELLRLEEEITQSKLQKAILDKQLRVLSLETADNSKKILEAKSSLDLLQNENTRISREITDKQAEVAKMRAASSSAGQLTFRIMQPSPLPPFYLIAAQNKLWTVGPFPSPDGSRFVPGSDCAFSIKNVSGAGETYVCIPNPDKGVPLLRNHAITQEARKLLDSVPKNRVPQISVHRDSTEGVFALREYLQKNKVLHGVDTEYDRNKKFEFVISNEARNYEY